MVGFRQRTLRDSVGCTGIGLHSGQKVRMTIKPAPPDTGIRFIRKDLPGKRVIEAHFDNVSNTTMCTVIGDNGNHVSTIEHLMAAFFGFGIDNAIVEIDGPEVPIMDGSSAPFIFLLKSAGIKEHRKPKEFILIKKTINVQEGNRSITIRPSKELKISFAIDFHHPLIKNQQYAFSFSGKGFIDEISRARTFGFLKDIEALREAGLARGGSLDNAIVIDDFKVINQDGLRYDDEFVRHKILDFLGDIAVMGTPIIGHFIVNRSGHSLNHAMLKKLASSQRHWKRITMEEPGKESSRSFTIPAFGSMEPVPA
ncbi:MAG: UDP-3-O-acyl-N-acetylglucosamine deacetylase [Deltaproteobacteria bacterium]|nr:UDP-3-O-acyl-N-acetylglucosamine deacetylase [Deltaproteobacteria bacterium]